MGGQAQVERLLLCRGVRARMWRWALRRPAVVEAGAPRGVHVLPMLTCLMWMTGRWRHRHVHLNGRSMTTASGYVSGLPPLRYEPIFSESAYMAWGVGVGGW